MSTAGLRKLTTHERPPVEAEPSDIAPLSGRHPRQGAVMGAGLPRHRLCRRAVAPQCSRHTSVGFGITRAL